MLPFFTSTAIRETLSSQKSSFFLPVFPLWRRGRDGLSLRTLLNHPANLDYKVCFQKWLDCACPTSNRRPPREGARAFSSSNLFPFRLYVSMCS